MEHPANPQEFGPQPAPVTHQQFNMFQQHMTSALEGMAAQIAQVAAAVQGAQQPAAPPQPAPPPPPSPVVPQLPSAFKIPKPSAFTGNPKELTSWLFSMESYLQHTGVELESPQAAAAAASYLQQSAVIWYESAVKSRGTQHPFASFDEFKHALTVFYLPVSPAVTARDWLMTFKQTGQFRDYVRAYQELMLQIPNMVMEDRVHKFIWGLRNKEVQTHVWTLEPKTVVICLSAGLFASKTLEEAINACQGCAVTDFPLRFTEISVKFQLKFQSPVAPL